MKKNIFILGFLFVLTSTGSPAQIPTADQILQNVKKQFDNVQDYTANLVANINMERLKIPEMKVKLYFKKPNKFHVESNNFAMLPREGVGLNPDDLIKKFDGTLMGTDQADGSPVYRVRLISKPEKGKVAREIYVSVEAAHWMITRFESTPAEGRKVTIDFEHTTVDGKYVLPSKISAVFDLVQNKDSLTEKMYNPQRQPRRGSATITYTDYKVNTGLSDEIFEVKKPEGKKEEKVK